MTAIDRLLGFTHELCRLPRNLSRSVRYSGSQRHCPVCSRSARLFRPAGIVKRLDANCPFCGAMERHRLTWHYLEKNSDLFNGQAKAVLHVAPEPCFSGLLKRRLGSSYLTADLTDPKAMVRMDITAITYASDHFDVILCNHVLEHIPDDRLAMRELCRVLKPGGWALLLVPIVAELTEEDPSITEPKERLKQYGHEEHVRNYGRDYADRLRSCGFTVEVILPSALASTDECIRMGFTPAAGEIYRCTKLR